MALRLNFWRSIFAGFYDIIYSVAMKTLKIFVIALLALWTAGCTSYLSVLALDQKDVASDLQGFSIDIVRGTFILATNLDSDNRALARQVVETGVDALYNEYFTTKLSYPIKLYIFKNKKTYEDYVLKTYKKSPGTPFGFYIPRERKIMLDFSTGAGTLMHEIIHPMISADFPQIPAWFNEGFASLFEESIVIHGKLKGKVNWRLKTLKDYLSEHDDVNLMDVFSQAESSFYGTNSSLNYAIARYLCMWLQEKGVLKKFYKQFGENVNGDKAGIKTLEKVVGKDISLIQKEWIKWTRALDGNSLRR